MGNFIWAADVHTLLEKSWAPSGTPYRVVIESELSNPKSDGQGYCGSGEEVFLRISSAPYRTSVFSKRIESCLTTVELIDGDYGGETRETISKAVRFQGSKIQWAFQEGGTFYNARVDLNKKTITYRQTRTSH